jgi:two-component system response regulator AtoC
VKPEAGRSLRLLIVDDEAKLAELLKRFLEQEGHRVTTAASGEEARELLESRDFDAVVTDLRMPGLGGQGLLAWLQESGPTVPALVMSAFGEVADAVESMRHGALDYLVKPFEPAELLFRIDKALTHSRLERELRIRDRVEPRTAKVPDGTWAPSARGLIDSSDPVMRRLLDTARKAAPSTASVLIEGESGTGKEVLAAWIHGLSDRADRPFVPVNLGAVPEGFLETELFGHEKGAFTGAERRKTGMFELANGGTLFLDEIGDMPLHLQVKVLRVLQDRRIQRLGATGLLPIDIRVIAATHRDLSQLVREGKFREDLLYRLKVIPLRIPPLRERLEDLPALVAFIMDKLRRPGGASSVSGTAFAALARYPFPGNIRELENLLERALILCEEPVLRARDFGLEEPRQGDADGEISMGKVNGTRFDARGGMADDTAAPEPGSTLEAIERWAILRELGRQGGRRQAAAEALGINRRTLLNKLNEYGLKGE